jgi:hypothetical protein
MELERKSTYRLSRTSSPASLCSWQVGAQQQGRAVGNEWCSAEDEHLFAAPASGSWDDWSLNITLPIDQGTGEAGIVLELDASQHGVSCGGCTRLTS